MKAEIRLRQLSGIFESYAYPLPFQQHLQDCFRKNKNIGSRDRKELRSLSFSYLRLGKALQNADFNKRIQTGGFLCNPSPVLEFENPVFRKEDFQLSLIEKIKIVRGLFPDFNETDIFPNREAISPKLDSEEIILSCLHQPSVWIKTIEQYEFFLKRELEGKGITYEIVAPQTWKFPPESKLTELESFRKGHFRIQDLSTQTTAQYFKANAGENWWDCCAGAGGKSLALLDIQPDVNLFVSDIRESILDNLKYRFDLYGWKPKKIFKANLEMETPPSIPQMDGIIADVPCSGSGTWARSPEHLSHFRKEQIAEYSRKQLNILKNAWSALKTGKPLIYITCSVYEEENEKVIEAFKGEYKVKIEEEKYLEGYKYGAENIFLCRMIKTGTDRS